MKSIKFSCPDDLRAQLAKQARKESRGKSERVSQSQIVRRALRAHLEKVTGA